MRFMVIGAQNARRLKFIRRISVRRSKLKEAKQMKGSRLIVAILLLSLALVCFISAPVFSGDDPWDVDGDSDNGSGSNDDIISPPPVDSLIVVGTTSIGEDNDYDWLSGLVFQISYEIITYIFGDNDKTSDGARVEIDESCGNVTAQ